MIGPPFVAVAEGALIVTVGAVVSITSALAFAMFWPAGMDGLTVAFVAASVMVPVIELMLKSAEVWLAATLYVPL